MQTEDNIHIVVGRGSWPGMRERTMGDRLFEVLVLVGVVVLTPVLWLGDKIARRRPYFYDIGGNRRSL